MNSTLSVTLGGVFVIILCSVIPVSAGPVPWTAELTAAFNAYEEGDTATAIKQWQIVITQAKENKIEGPQLATALNRLAGYYISENKFDQAEPLLKRALLISEKTLGKIHPDVAPVLDNYVIVMRKTNRPALADQMDLRAKAIWLQCAPAEDFKTTPAKKSP
ncbi:tetratricopeptide repeat protein [Pseudomonadota bacterium]